MGRKQRKISSAESKIVEPARVSWFAVNIFSSKHCENKMFSLDYVRKSRCREETEGWNMVLPAVMEHVIFMPLWLARISAAFRAVF